MSSSARLSGTLRPTKSPEGNPPNVARAPISSFFSHSHRCIGASTISLLPLPQCSESLSFGFARSRRTVAQGPQSLAAFLSQRRVSPPFFFLRLNIPWRNWAQIHTSRKRIWRCARCVSIWNYNILLLLPFYFSVWRVNPAPGSAHSSLDLRQETFAWLAVRSGARNSNDRYGIGAKPSQTVEGNEEKKS